MDDLRNKDKKLIEIVTQLTNSLKGQSIEFVDYWEADLYATGFVINNKLVYVSTWDLRHSKKLVCFCELELITNNLEEPYTVYKTFKQIDLETLIAEVAKFAVS